MSYDKRGRPYGAPGLEDDGDARKGSVRAARQRLQVAQMRTQLPDTSKIIGLPQRPNQLVSQYSAQTRAEQQQQQPPNGRNGTEDTTTSPPQWPLPNEVTAAASSPVLPPRSPKRLQPPQQNIRPIADDDPVQQRSPDDVQPTSPAYLQPPSPDYPQSYRSDELFSPASHRSSRPLTTSSVLSEASSLGSIPDFPVPQPPMPSIQQARRMPGLGPPPSSRRGPSSYYTQISYVSPIAEESDARSDAIQQSRHGSFASSNVFPSHNDDFYQNDDLMSDDDSTITSDRGTISPMEQDDRRGLVQQSPALVRQASLGRRTKPSLMTIKSVDSLGERKGTGKPKSEGARAALGGAGGAMLGARSATQSKHSTSRQNANLGVGSASADVSSSSSESLNSSRNTRTLAAAAFGSTQSLQQEIPPTTLADRAGMRRPPKLDMDAVRDAEARGSLTSLPELIRRATRLAANLDRGRTASRLALDFWETGGPDKDMRQSGLSDMLAAFPPPGQDTPLRSGTPNAANSRMSKWPSGGNSRLGVTDSGMSNEKPKGRRRCCGMPMWTFVTLMIVLLFIIAAAVVIPVVLVVIPNQNRSSNNAAQNGPGNNNNNNDNDNDNSSVSNTMSALPVPTLTPGTGQCDGVITCQNGGISILNSDRTCNCVNGFTGKTCTNNDATGCTTTSISGAANNATVGTAISRLLGSGADSLNVPLSSTRVLAIFSDLSLSCPAQNALITFNGLASRSEKRFLHSINLRHALEPSKSLPILHHPHPAHAPELKAKRQAIGGPGRPGESKTVQASATPTLPVSSNPQALDFARIGVLFALQESGELDTAAKAQESIQNFLTNNRNGNSGSNSINMGPFKIDLVQLTITLNNGTTIRASPSSSPS